LPQIEQVAEADREKAREQLMRQLLDKLIAERLIALRAKELSVVVFEDAVERALEKIAMGSKRTVPELFQEALRLGFTEADYRAEVRRAVLDSRVLALEVLPKIRSEGLSEKELEEKIIRGKVDFLNALASQHSIEDRL
jgi:parvulin-like peptidyl-prolyl isomerase